MQSSYNPWLVAMSFVVATLSSYTALDLTARYLRAGVAAAAAVWRMGAAALGVGIWSMHFVAMLAFSLPIPLGYDFAETAYLLAPAIGASYLALCLTTRARLTVARLMGEKKKKRRVHAASASPACTRAAWPRCACRPPLAIGPCGSPPRSRLRSARPRRRCGWRAPQQRRRTVCAAQTLRRGVRDGDCDQQHALRRDGRRRLRAGRDLRRGGRGECRVARDVG